MIGLGIAASIIALAVLWTTRKGRTPTGTWLLYAAVAAPLTRLRQLLRVDLHRGRPAAVDRLRVDDDRQRRLAECVDG